MRLQNWPIKLDQYLRANRGRAFAYGSWDCFQFVRGAVEAMTGLDIGERARPYHSRFGYLRQMVRFCDSAGLEDLAGQLLEEYGAREVPARAAARGDVVVMETPEGQVMGLVSLDGTAALGLAPSGAMVRLPLYLAAGAWSF